MKKYSFLLLLLTLLLFSCSNEQPGYLILGTWKLDNIKYERPISDEVKPMIEAHIQTLRETFRVEYKPDSSYHAHSFKDVHGKWELSVDGKKLRHFPNDNESELYEVIKLSKDSLHLRTTIKEEVLTLQFIPSK